MNIKQKGPIKTLLHSKSIYNKLLLQGRKVPGIYITDLAKQYKILVVTFDRTIKIIGCEVILTLDSVYQ